jgi:hypothetical protein
MYKIHKPSDSECYAPSSEPFRFRLDSSEPDQEPRLNSRKQVFVSGAECLLVLSDYEILEELLQSD